MDWKGLETVDAALPINRRAMVSGQKAARQDIDLTSMVDVTFLLLVFFMVTASFTMSAVLPQPQVSDLPSPLAPIVDLDQMVCVEINQNNMFSVELPDGEWTDVASERQLRAVLRDARNEYQIERMMIRAHVDSLHSKVIQAMDIAKTVGFSRVEMTTATDAR